MYAARNAVTVPKTSSSPAMPNATALPPPGCIRTSHAMPAASGSRINAASHPGRFAASPRAASHATQTAVSVHTGASANRAIIRQRSPIPAGQRMPSTRFPSSMPAASASGTVMLTSSHGIFSAAMV